MSDVLSRGKLKKFPKPVADVLLAEVAGHPRLSVRFMDATHLRIYDGSAGHPFQVAANRPAEDAMRKLRPWLDKRTITEEEVMHDRSADRSAEDQPTVEDMVVDAAREGIDAGNGFTTDGSLYVCTTCGFSKTNRQGMHLHEATHNEHGSLQRRAAETRRANVEGRKATALEALQTLASALGIELVTPAVYDAVVAERDEARAKLALYAETFKTLRGL